MKKIALLIVLAVVGLSVSAKVYDFESNDLGWNEYSGQRGEALIKEGVLFIEGKVDGTAVINDNGRLIKEFFLSSTCYLPIEVTRTFEIKADVFAKKLKNDAGFGIIFNYRDDENFHFFLINAVQVKYYRIENAVCTGYREDRIKFRSKKKAEIALHLKKSFDKVALIVDDVQVLEIPYIEYKYQGIGFFTIGEQTITFDNLETILK